MDDILHRFEAQIKTLIQQCDQLKQVNLKLKQSRATLVREKELLLTKHKAAISLLENMVSRLKSLEN